MKGHWVSVIVLYPAEPDVGTGTVMLREDSGSFSDLVPSDDAGHALAAAVNGEPVEDALLGV